jgi:hypothetical protein
LRKKNKYLYQLVITSCLLIIIPLSISFSFLLERSYKEIKQNNNAYYQDMTQLFRESVVNEISEFNEYATAFSATSRKGVSSGGIFYEGTDKMTTSEFYWWKAGRELVEYSKKVGYDAIGVYFYDLDVVLYDGYKYSAEHFVNNKLGVAADDMEIRDFFSQSRYERFATVFAPVFQEDGSFQSMLVGACVRLGKNSERALLFYQMQASLNYPFAYPHLEERGDRYYVVDSKSGDFLFGLGIDENCDTSIEEICNTDESKFGKRQEVFSENSAEYDLIFIVDTSDNIEQDVIARFYQESQSFVFCVILAMVALAIVVVYLNYRPIYYILKKIKGEGNSEFEIIENKLQNQHIELDEQRLLIVDLLMNRLLYGLPIPEQHVNKLGVGRSIQRYCVFLIDQYVLDSAESDHVIAVVEEQFNAMLFFSDIQGEKATIIIAFMETDNSDEIGAWLCRWSAENIKHAHSIAMGCAVNHINDISKSLDSCRQQIKAKNNDETPSNRQRSENYEKLKDSVMQFLEENYSNKDLSQTMVADYFHISAYSLSRIFKKHLGCCPSDYLRTKADKI